MTIPAPLPAADYIPSTPDPQMVGVVLMVLRYVVVAASGLGFAWASKIPTEGLQVAAQAISALIMAGTLAYGYFERRRLAQLDHAGSVRSAQSGQAVKAIAAGAA